MSQGVENCIIIVDTVGLMLIPTHEVNVMEISYKKLWKLLIDKDMKKKDLQSSAGISWASVTKLSKGEAVSMDVLIKVCKAMSCDIGDIVELIPKDNLNA